MNGQRHCIVIGAGIIGSSCAWHLLKKGFRVSIVDDQEPGQVTSFGNAGCISPSSILPLSYPGVIADVPRWLLDADGPMKIRWRDFPALSGWFWRFWRAGKMSTVKAIAAAQTRLMRPVTAAFDEILAATGSLDLRQHRGCLMVYDNEARWASGSWQYDMIREHGFTVRDIGPAELAELEPDVRAGFGQARLLEDWQHLLNPGEVCKRIADDFAGTGGTLIRDRVRSVAVDGAGVALGTQSGQTLRADHLVCAAGVWSNAIARQLDRAVPMTPKRGYHSMLPAPGVTLNRPVYFASKQFIATPMQHGLRLAGTGEFARIDAPPNYERARALVRTARQYLPNLDAQGASEWMGQRPMMADSMPVIGPSPACPQQVTYAFGHGHYGLTQGPLTGRLVAQLVAGEAPEVDLTPFRFDRF